MPIKYECRGCGIRKNDPWEGRCPNPRCQRFFNYRRVNSDKGGKWEGSVEDTVVALGDIKVPNVDFLETGVDGFDYVTSGGDTKRRGVAAGGIYLLCGSPGSGKSTLLAQVLRGLAQRRHSVLYVAGEEPLDQFRDRIRNIGKIPARFQAVRPRHMTVDDILDRADEVKPRVVAIDSIQCVEVDDDLEIGSTSSIKAAIRVLSTYAKDEMVTMIIIGHITKDGAIGGPKTLEYLVDVSLYLQGRPNQSERYLRCDSKNRFTRTGVLARFQMTDKGLVEIGVPGDDLSREAPRSPKSQ